MRYTIPHREELKAQGGILFKRQYIEFTEGSYWNARENKIHRIYQLFTSMLITLQAMVFNIYTLLTYIKPVEIGFQYFKW